MAFQSLLNLGFFASIATIVDIIPKVVYFLYAMISSGVDAMQAMVRKLAGLDVYYQASTGNPVAETDPLTEFIYGILGIGDNAAMYQGLNTVFWSLAIFGLIILVVATIVAIIKSHYNEDTAGTSPWKYVYTAIKAIFTFVIIPVAVVVGMQFSSFILKTLDTITAGGSSAEQLETTFGSDAREIFRGETIANTDSVSYTYYDFFGSGDPCNSTTFSGMLFKASMYSANRARNGGVSISNYQQIRTSEGQIFGVEEVLSNIQSSEDRQEYVASQIDYAFANNLQLNTAISYSQAKSWVGDGAPVAGFTDLFAMGKTSIGSFSKYDVCAVWLFYNLWQQNFIVEFAAGFFVFAIMISIIIGLMSRLIKGAALFLLYPSLLGLAPMDNFKAFKSWGQNFLQQLLMAFGSIIGINLLLLILPYVQNIEFFEADIINLIINVVILITGLIMAKDFISLVSGFIGGADANNVGGSMKGEVGAQIKKGAGITAKAGLGTAKVLGGAALATGKLAGKAGAAAGRGLATATARKRANKNLKKANEITAKMQNMDPQTRQSLIQEATLNKKMIDNTMAGKYNGNGNMMKAGEAGEKAYNRAYQAAIRDGKSEEEAKNIAESKKRSAIERSLYKNDTRFKNRADAINEWTSQKHDRDNAKAKAEEIAEKYHLKKDENTGQYDRQVSLGSEFRGFLKNTGSGIKNGLNDTFRVSVGKDENGNDIKTGLFTKEGMAGLGKHIADEFNQASSWKNVGKSIADSFMKTLAETTGGFGLDKGIASATDILKQSLTFQGGVFRPAPPPTDIVQRQAHEDQKTAAKASQDLAKQQLELMKDFLKGQNTQNQRLEEMNRGITELSKNNPPPTDSGKRD